VKSMKEERNDKYSYYVSTDLISSCIEQNKKNFSKENKSCIELKKQIDTALSLEIFDDLSFEYFGFEVIQNITKDLNIRFNTWIDFEQFKKIDQDLFNYIIIKNNDPNSI